MSSAAQTALPETPENDNKLIAQAYRDLLRAIKTSLSPRDSQMIREAFEMAVEAHRTQRRKSGEPYILHPIEVARICVEEIGLGPTAVVCALLHDVVEDTDVTLKEIHAKFGDRVSLIVDGLTKLDGLTDSESPQAENLTKVLKTMVSDVRVVLIKMADRLHNMRTIKSMPIHKQLKIAAETSYIYTPLAHRLGLYNIKSEFQDICLKITHPEEFFDIADRLAETKQSREQYIIDFMKPIQKALEDIGYPVRIHGRPKSIYSIYNKIKNKDVDFKEIYDLFAIRIIIDLPPEYEKLGCWNAYTIVTDVYKPIIERLKDWIGTPKSNGYESLHTTVIGPEGRFVEVQIRSERMDAIAERGFAAHWKYKGIKNLSTSKRDVFDNWINQIRESLEQANDSNPVEFLADFQSQLFANEVHVFTPKGEMKILPDGATPLDFAFSIHSDIGCKCISAKIDNRLVPISEKLRNGDQVQIITSKNQKPTEDWLKFVVTSKARTRIKAALKDEKRGQADYGKEILERKLNAFKVPVEPNVDTLAYYYGYPDQLEFLSAIYLEQVNLSLLKNFKADGQKLVLIEIEKPAEIPIGERISESQQPAPAPAKSDIILNGDTNTKYAFLFPICCNPVQGDPIFAYLKSNQTAVIHRTTCPNATNILSQYGHRIVRADWGNSVKSEFVAELIIKGIDTGVGVIRNLTEKISYDLGLNIREFSISGHGGYFEGKMSVVVQNADMLNMAIRLLKNVEGVASVMRAESAS